MAKRGGMGGQRWIILIILVVVLFFGYRFFHPAGKYHEPDCFWVHIYTKMRPKDFPTDARFIGLYKSSGGQNYHVYTDRQRGEVTVAKLKRCPWCRPPKP